MEGSEVLYSLQDDTHGSRIFARDGKCLITGLESYTYTRLKVANMIPPADESQASHASVPNVILFNTLSPSIVALQRKFGQNHQKIRGSLYGEAIKDRSATEWNHTTKRYM